MKRILITLIALVTIIGLTGCEEKVSKKFIKPELVFVDDFNATYSDLSIIKKMPINASKSDVYLEFDKNLKLLDIETSVKVIYNGNEYEFSNILTPLNGEKEKLLVQKTGDVYFRADLENMSFNVGTSPINPEESIDEIEVRLKEISEKLKVSKEELTVWNLLSEYSFFGVSPIKENFTGRAIFYSGAYPRFGIELANVWFLSNGNVEKDYTNLVLCEGKILGKEVWQEENRYLIKIKDNYMMVELYSERTFEELKELIESLFELSN